MKKTLHLFRHGQTDWNTEGRLQGHTDIPLNEEGQKQALALQDYFSLNQVDLFISSDLIRAKQTAEIANALTLKPLTTHSSLRESFMGELEGMTRLEARHRFGADSWDKWASVHPSHADFAFPGAESARVTISRVLQTLKSICEDLDFSHAGICTHGLVMRRLLHHLKPEMQEVLAVPNCSVYQVHWEQHRGLYFNS